MNQVVITDGPRTVKRHIEVYKKLEKTGRTNGKPWHEVIPWGSYHLPAFGKKLRAVDLAAVKSRGSLNDPVSYYKGTDIFAYLSEIEKEIDAPLGIGVGRSFCHVDVGRDKSAVWYYNY